jgi:RimJ/RimL family protein N-acetyltransferase
MQTWFTFTSILDKLQGMNHAPIILTGQLIRLEPLAENHVPDLTRAGQDDAIWRYMPYGLIRTQEQMTAWVRDALTQISRGTDLPFAVILKASGQAIGSTRYLAFDPLHLSLEIGGTWYATEHQRTGVNTECKYLLLTHAFEVLGCIRVQLKTDLRNVRSQQAIERIGAVREGVLRKCLIMPDRYQRSTVVYSILDDEWPRVKTHLEQLMT